MTPSRVLRPWACSSESRNHHLSGPAHKALFIPRTTKSWHASSSWKAGANEPIMTDYRNLIGSKGGPYLHSGDYTSPSGQ